MFVSESLDELCLCVWALIRSGVNRTLGVEWKWIKSAQIIDQTWANVLLQKDDATQQSLKQEMFHERLVYRWDHEYSAVQTHISSAVLIHCFSTLWQVFKKCVGTDVYGLLSKYILIAQFLSTRLVGWHLEVSLWHF